MVKNLSLDDFMSKTRLARIILTQRAVLQPETLHWACSFTGCARGCQYKRNRGYLTKLMKRIHYPKIDPLRFLQVINGDLLRTVAKFVESAHWKESLKILKLAVTRSSTLVAPPSSGAMSYHWETTEADVYFKKELPGTYPQNSQIFHKNATCIQIRFQDAPWNSLLICRKRL